MKRRTPYRRRKTGLKSLAHSFITSNSTVEEKPKEEKKPVKNPPPPKQ